MTRATVVADVGDLRASGAAPGTIQIRRLNGEIRGVAFTCPCGCGNESYLPSDAAGHDSGWRFTGPDNALTAHPSVYNTGMPCQWHGWLRNGEWVT